MRRLRDQAHRAMLIVARVMIRANDQQAGVLALRSGVGLERDASEAGDVAEPLLEAGEELGICLLYTSDAADE